MLSFGILLFSDHFAQLKMESKVDDFYEVEYFALEILEDESTGAAREQREQYRYLLIDEYQDSNEVQETILRAISRESIGEYNMFMVGDVKQSIYQFRLAKPDIFEEKRRTYTDNESCNMRIMLKRNFRSSPAI